MLLLFYNIDATCCKYWINRHYLFFFKNRNKQGSASRYWIKWHKVEYRYLSLNISSRATLECLKHNEGRYSCLFTYVAKLINVSSVCRDIIPWKKEMQIMVLRSCCLQKAVVIATLTVICRYLMQTPDFVLWSLLSQHVWQKKRELWLLRSITKTMILTWYICSSNSSITDIFWLDN